MLGNSYFNVVYDLAYVKSVLTNSYILKGIHFLIRKV